MNLRAGSLLTFLLALATFKPAAADDEELKALVKELAGQVKQLTSRVSELEQKLSQAQAAKSPPSPPTVPAQQTNAASALASKPASASPSPMPFAKAAGPLPTMPPGITGSALGTTQDNVDLRRAVTVGDVKGSFKIPGTETSLAIGGYAKLDAIYNSISSGINNFTDLLLVPSAIPVGEARQGEHSQVNFTARESRFWLKSFTPTAWGELNTFLEMDFYAFQSPGDERATNSHAPRLRHAYGSLGHLLAGQTWSTFMNVAALPETNDHGGPVGQIFVRQALIRWSQPFDAGGVPLEFQAALESPETTLTLPDGNRLTTDDDRAPDIVGRVNYTPTWGSLSAAGMARLIRNSQNTADNESSRWGGAVSLAGRVKTFDLDNIRFMLNYGNVLGRYTTYDIFNDGALEPNGTVALFDVFAAFISYQHWWNANWRSTVAYGFAQADNPAFVAGTANRQAQSVHVNLLWSPLLQTTIGLEYIYARRELESGESGDLQRVQFSTRFNF
ncbi:DcaP family trimeric outer membrane transporter [Methyloterricola oryzae]|uniref:DcaP family trimeric outer membrane transporter n=1 Tax=Methyloterricola oryzae TaxID=1495050 RepID=UPI0009E216CC|nr:DcaP family trimeric outer membrane transporter [Methyloterricola oryzae]